MVVRPGTSLTFSYLLFLLAIEQVSQMGVASGEHFDLLYFTLKSFVDSGAKILKSNFYLPRAHCNQVSWSLLSILTKRALWLLRKKSFVCNLQQWPMKFFFQPWHAYLFHTVLVMGHLVTRLLPTVATSLSNMYKKLSQQVAGKFLILKLSNSVIIIVLVWKTVAIKLKAFF